VGQRDSLKSCKAITTFQTVSEDIEQRPIIYIPESLRLGLPAQGCVLELTLHDGRTIPGVCIDSKGMIYGVLVQKSVDERQNPIDFFQEEIASVKILAEIPSNYHFV
jgi:hypothetical protein